jgi:hypothetical protein
MRTILGLIAVLLAGLSLFACSTSLVPASPTPTPTAPLPTSPGQTSNKDDLPTATVSSTADTYLASQLGIAVEHPIGWYVQDAPAEPVDVLLTSYDPADPPHKLEWGPTTVSIGIRAIPTEEAPDSLETWMESAKQEALAEMLSVFAEERLTLATGYAAAHITLVSGSGGIIERVLVDMDGRYLDIIVQGNFALAIMVLDTLRPIGY